MLIPLESEDRNSHLKAKLLLIGDVGLMDQIHITDRDGLQHFRSKTRRIGVQVGLLLRTTFSV
jgi:hypothetical protein